MSKFFRVLAVDGPQFIDPFSIGTPQKRVVGYKRVERGTRLDPRQKDPVPHYAYEFDAEAGPQIVAESTDHFVRRAIMDGTIDYVETVDFFGEPKEKSYREAALVLATKKNRDKREAQAAALKKHAEMLAAHEAEELAAAEAGLTLEEARAKKSEAKSDAAG